MGLSICEVGVVVEGYCFDDGEGVERKVFEVGMAGLEGADHLHVDAQSQGNVAPAVRMHPDWKDGAA